MANTAARTKWVLSKSITNTVSSDLKSFLHLSNGYDTLHHGESKNYTAKVAEYVSKVSNSVLQNSFMSTSTALVNIVTGVHVCKDVEYELTHIKEIG